MADAPGMGGEKAGAEPRVYVLKAPGAALPQRLAGRVVPVDPAEACRLEGRGVLVVPPGYRLPCKPGLSVVEGPPSLEALADYMDFYGLPEPGAEPPWMDRAAALRLALRLASAQPRGPWPRGRPPPVLVYSEYYAGRGVGEAWRRLALGADAVVVGARDRDEALEALRQAASLASRGVPVGFDYWDVELQSRAALSGAGLVLSLTVEALGGVEPRARGRAWFVLVPSKPRAPWRERVGELCAALREARGAGYGRVILDPVLNPPVYPGALEGLVAAWELARRCPRGVPVMLGLNNFYELVDADSHGVVTALASLAAEAGVEVLLVGEESWKARGATLEARVAAEMAGLALRWRVPPKDVGFSLLLVKGKRPPPAEP